MNPYLVFILAVLVGHSLLEAIVSLLNLRSLKPTLPTPFIGVYDAKAYARSQEYTRVRTRFGLFQGTVSTAVTVLFILVGGFNWLDLLARSPGLGTIATGVLYIGLLLLVTGLFGLPFSLYSTFVIEERYGFNRTTVRTYILDLLKSILLALVIGAPLLAFVLWFFEAGGSLAWLFCWLAVAVFMLTMQFLAPVVIMPLFNRFTPLDDGPLKEAVINYARAQRFAMRGVYTMDGSKRSSRLNAFFTGFGRFRRIVFFDTLLEALDIDEVVAVLAHEMGHYRRGHIFKMMAASILQMGMMFFVLSLFLGNRELAAAFGMEQVSIYASLVFFGFIFSPVSTFLGIVLNKVSRTHEYEADRYAAATTGHPHALVSALKKLSLANLSNLTPHPLHVMLHYSHPPVLARIGSLEEMADG